MALHDLPIRIMLIYLTRGLGVAGVPDMKVISTLTDITQSPEEEKKFSERSEVLALGDFLLIH